MTLVPSLLVSDIGIPFYFLSEVIVPGPARTKAGQVIAFISTGVSPAPGEMSCSTGLVVSKVKVTPTSLSQLNVETSLGES